MTTPPGSSPGSPYDGYGQSQPAGEYGRPAPQPQQGWYPAPPAGYPGQPGQPKSNGFGVTALVLGILSLPAAFFAGVPGIVLGAAAIVFAVLGLKRVKAGRADNRGLTIAGLVTGIIGLLLGVVIFILVVAVFKSTADCTSQFQGSGNQSQYQQCLQDNLND